MENANYNYCSYVKRSTFTFFKGQKNKMAKFLADKGIYIIEEKKYHIVRTQWVKIRIFVTYRIKEILSFIKVKSAV